MILDKLERWSDYASPESNLGKAFQAMCDFLKNEDFSVQTIVREDGIKLLAQEYTTLDPSKAKWESHRRMIDIQFVVEGNEVMLWAPTERAVDATPYNETKDVLHYADAQAPSELVVQGGSFAVFFPEDAHKPQCAWEKSETVRKIVMKVPV